MTYENDIPEYALQPARAPKVIEAEAICDTERITYPAEEQTVVYQFEEDILVPDTKPDMREILLMDASADILPAEKRVSPKTDDLLNITGVITLQTIYNSESEDREPVSITSKVPYKYQWSLNPMEQAEGVFEPGVRNVEYMIVNERKFRVKITLEFTARLFCEKEMQFFEGLKDEPLQMKRESAAMTCLALVKKDEVSVDETFSAKEPGLRPKYILKQDFSVMENYRQITTEKVVINGFVFCSLLYSAEAAGEEEGRTAICQHNQRIEFTQFVPLEKENRGKNWSSVRTFFNSRDLTVSIEQDEEDGEDVRFRIKGSVQARVELYERRERTVITDAYHREKFFECDFVRDRISNVSDSAAAEASVREIIGLPEGAKAAEAVYCSGKVLEYQCGCERGKAVVSGSVSCCAVWKDQEGVYRAERIVQEFRGTADMESAVSGQKVSCRPLIKEAWAELINEKQLEINCSLSLAVETCDETEIVMLRRPRFVDRPREKEYPMVIVTMQSGESLWELAKRYRTTEEQIRSANQLEEEPQGGQRLLIVK